MTRQLTAALRRQKKQTQQEILKIPGSLGITIGGQKRVEVPNRNSFVYVRLRDNQNELIQAFNNKVAPSYGLPVIVERQGNRYIVTSVDSLRYNNNYNSFAPFLPRHGNTHSFDFENGGAGDPVWVYSRQMMPALIMPSGSDGGPNAILNAYTLKNADGTWKYVGVTGTPNITQYKPTNNQAVMVLVYLDSLSGNPYLMVGSGSYFANTITGSAAIVPYIPTLVDPNHIPLAAVRLVSGTNALSWNNIYDVRQWLHPIPSGTSSGGGGGTGTSIAIWEDGVPQGVATTLNFFGINVDASVSGSVASIGIGGFGGASGSVALYDSLGQLTYRQWLRYGDVGAVGYLDFGSNQIKETNAGRIGYGIFGVGYLYIVGAGTDPSDRRVQIYDKLYVSSLVEAGSFNITDPASTYNITGSPHTHSYISTDGWITASDVWTRTGNHTFTISGDVTTVYRKGTKVKYSDGGTEYGLIGSSSHAAGTTTINLIPNTDYAMSASPSSRYISYIENPEGFPAWFNFTSPTVTGQGSMTWGTSTTIHAVWRPSGKDIEVSVFLIGTVGGIANVKFFIAPPIAVGSPLTTAKLGITQVRDAASGNTVVGSGFIDSTNGISVYKADSSNWTLGLTHILFWNGSYPY